VSKGTRVVVTGVLAVRKWARDERSGINVTVRAETVGIDLQWAKVQQIIKTSTSHRSEGEETPADDDWMPDPESAPADEASDPDVDEGTDEVREGEAVPTPF
jgi:single-stranded DNA-binding protein